MSVCTVPDIDHLFVAGACLIIAVGFVAWALHPIHVHDIEHGFDMRPIILLGGLTMVTITGTFSMMFI